MTNDVDDNLIALILAGRLLLSSSSGTNTRTFASSVDNKTAEREKGGERMNGAIFFSSVNNVGACVPPSDLSYIGEKFIRKKK